MITKILVMGKDGNYNLTQKDKKELNLEPSK